jgi:adenosylcobinamide-GDP ribazoletransferase
MDTQQFVKGLRSGTGFLTTLPAGWDEKGFDIFFSHNYFFVIIGILIGLLLGVLGLIFQWFIPAPIIPVLVIAAIYLITGINHLDGLSDFGDGFIASGTKEKKVAAMKDVHAGAGGILFIGMDLLFLYAAVSMFAGMGGYYLFAGLIVAEVCAKVCMTTAIAFGKSLPAGMGKALMDKTKKDHYIIGLAIAIIVCVLAAGFAVAPWFDARYALIGFLSVSVSAALGLFIADLAEHNFGGVNGDVMGAANEIGRIAALIVLGILIWKLW